MGKQALRALTIRLAILPVAVIFGPTLKLIYPDPVLLPMLELALKQVIMKEPLSPGARVDPIHPIPLISIPIREIQEPMPVFLITRPIPIILIPIGIKELPVAFPMTFPQLPRIPFLRPEHIGASSMEQILIPAAQIHIAIFEVDQPFAVSFAGNVQFAFVERAISEGFFVHLAADYFLHAADEAGSAFALSVYF